MSTNEMFDSFNKNYAPNKLELTHNSYDVNDLGYYGSRKVYTGSTVEIVMDGELFKKMVKSLYEVNEDAVVRDRNTAVQRAYENYKILLELSRK